MSKPIQVGDLVMVMHHDYYCSCHDGEYMVVLGIEKPLPYWRCAVCNIKVISRCDFVPTSPSLTIGGGMPLERLKRIDPPQFGDSLPTRRELEEKV